MAARNTWCHRTLDTGLGAVFPNIEIRHLHAVIVVAEELSFTRAAHRLHITQPALTRQITDLEKEHRFHLFTRYKRRPVELTDAGRVFVQEAKSALFHTERAIHLARATHEGADTVMLIGHSPYADPAWVAAILAIRLPLFPKTPHPSDRPVFPNGVGAKRHCWRTTFGPRDRPTP